MNSTEAKEMIKPVYDALTKPATKNVAAILDGALSPSWVSHGSAGTKKNKEQFVQMINGLGKLIPDLAFEIKECIASGNQVVVRSEATGTPVGPFMGVQPTGRSFKITTIDIHTLNAGKSETVHHVEDWMSAVQQLSAPQQ